MGIYQSDMILPESVVFPITLPKLCILIKYYELEDAFTDDIHINIFFPGDLKEAPSVSFLSGRKDTAPPPLKYELEEDQQRLFMLTLPFFVTPFQVKQEGFLKVRVHCGEVITNSGSLMIRKAQGSENNLLFPTEHRPQTG
jgi:hypothetical protein